MGGTQIFQLPLSDRRGAQPRPVEAEQKPVPAEFARAATLLEQAANGVGMDFGPEDQNSPELFQALAAIAGRTLGDAGAAQARKFEALARIAAAPGEELPLDAEGAVASLGVALKRKFARGIQEGVADMGRDVAAQKEATLQAEEARQSAQELNSEIGQTVEEFGIAFDKKRFNPGAWKANADMLADPLFLKQLAIRLPTEYSEVKAELRAQSQRDTVSDRIVDRLNQAFARDTAGIQRRERQIAEAEKARQAEEKRLLAEAERQVEAAAAPPEAGRDYSDSFPGRKEMEQTIDYVIGRLAAGDIAALEEHASLIGHNIQAVSAEIGGSEHVGDYADDINEVFGRFEEVNKAIANLDLDMQVVDTVRALKGRVGRATQLLINGLNRAYRE
ncbi:MAG: hypothetical protein COU33_00635 [Candidatus Magasanikbacteria bacterium CG10_big_fil_rev_8_21_14_0_10_43_6]|uniref:Uncharacterized protein n=1 Tax=Candidatus Magasanikbacteria bacterium CG10_big_fil_rev_8_21_14_0_10_43_6 TaxID=1974650 RepID=A0A2M6W285_9BACT|nr:MAG: hypothetical protein COU33_00635 [Candidatus Magasanikbacteria bacterium CG10_big_fil_rev_8_21_14_0_10_43_6]